jgi:tetratricopeptide (TPR) repeat protein
MMDEKSFEKIEDFLENNLTDRDLENFKEKMNNDPELRKECQLRRDINSAICEDDIMDLRSNLENICSDENSSSKQVRLINFKKYWVAASVIVIFGLSYFLYPGESLSNEDLFNEYYRPYNVIVNKRSAGFNTNEVLQKAMFYYETKDYIKALSLFRKVLEKDSTDITGNFYSGISNIEIKKYSEANFNFKKVIKHNNNFFIEQSEWYLGFCYLMTDQREKAIEQFEKIASGFGFYQAKAKEILDRIN